MRLRDRFSLMGIFAKVVFLRCCGLLAAKF